MKRSLKSLQPRGDRLLAPASWRELGFSLGVAVIMTLLPWSQDWRWLVPDVALMMLIYWHIHAPQSVGIGMAFVLGLLSDLAAGVLIGQHALSYSLAAFVVLGLHRRLEGFTAVGQAFQLVPVFFGQALLMLLSGMLLARPLVDWRYLLGGLVAALLWLPMAFLMDALAGRALARSDESGTEST